MVSKLLLKYKKRSYKGKTTVTNQRRMTDIFRESNLTWICHCLDQQKSLILRLNRGRKILEGGTRLLPNVFCIRFTCKGLHLSVSLGSSSLRGRQLREPKGPNRIFVIVARHVCFILYLVTRRIKKLPRFLYVNPTKSCSTF